MGEGGARRGADVAEAVSGRSSTPPREVSHDVRLFLPAVCGWVAVLLTLHRSVASCLALAAGAVLVALAGARFHRRRGARALALTGLVVALLLLAVAGHRTVRDAGDVEELAAQKATVHIAGVVDDDPRTLAPSPGVESTRVAVRVLVRQVRARGHQSSTRTPVLVMGARDLLRLRWRDEVTLTGRLAPAEPGERVAALVLARVVQHTRCCPTAPQIRRRSSIQLLSEP